MTARRLVLGLVVLLATAMAAAAADTPLAPGTAAPDFTVVDQHGKEFRLSEALARRDWLVLAFYPKAFSGT